MLTGFVGVEILDEKFWNFDESKLKKINDYKIWIRVNNPCNNYPDYLIKEKKLYFMLWYLNKRYLGINLDN
ncbi:unnamed protein product [Blepharisma stoltei]|uniref:Uncharacterized protein n=1 Tax=Blepharisma stoltei TaxID=1481888 RepID=A0AAU9J7E6_9CILI|nr:unnamed protein product [Blepharisma stoltei]